MDISEDFEHVQMPGQSEATPTGAGGGVATEQEDERAVELPPGWEERTVSYLHLSIIRLLTLSLPHIHTLYPSPPSFPLSLSLSLFPPSFPPPLYLTVRIPMAVSSTSTTSPELPPFSGQGAELQPLKPHPLPHPDNREHLWSGTLVLM